MRKSLLPIFLVIITLACAEQREAPDFFEFDEGVNLAELKNETLEEVSGLAASKLNEGMLWTENDSGNPAEVYLVNKELQIQLTCELKGAKNRDWEDIAVGPGPDSTKSYVYVGDIGDNIGRYNYKIIYRFEEPRVEAGVRKTTIDNYETIVFELPDERKDCETLLINPESKEIFVVSKREDPVTLYRVGTTALVDGDTLVATKVSKIDITFAVAGSFSPDGKELILKNIDNVYYWKIKENQSLKEAISQKPKVLPYKREAQGEAITFNTDGSGYFTLSELQSGEKSFLRFYKRKEQSDVMNVSK